MPKLLGPIYTADLFEPLHGELVALLRGLDEADWRRRTVARQWRVRDVVAHLLDTDLRAISVLRDGYHPPPPQDPIEDYGDLVAFLNRLNAEWVDAARRLSPAVLVELVTVTGREAADIYASLPPHEPAIYAVDWAGEEQSENWMHIGREYTEKWHHQMQIRDAVGAPRLLERRWLNPLLDLSVRALPHAYRDVAAPAGTHIMIEVSGEGGGAWTLECGDGGWQILQGAAASPQATIRLDPETAWRTFYNALSPKEARERAEVEGDETLAKAFFGTRSVIA